jgi:hypothetical protein
MKPRTRKATEDSAELIAHLIALILNPDLFVTVGAIASKSLRVYGGDDGARTRDLCRDSYANWLYLNDFMGVDG